MDVVKDLLDKPLVDRNGREMGRVDGIVLELTVDEPPRLSTVLIGASVLGERLHPAIGRWVAAIERAVGLGGLRPVRIEVRDLDRIDRKIKVTCAIGETTAGVVEQRVRGWLTRIPGAQ